jgi:hypothetical protein
VRLGGGKNLCNQKSQNQKSMINLKRSIFRSEFMSDFQYCFDSWDYQAGLFHATFTGATLTLEEYEGLYGIQPTNGTNLSTIELISRIQVREFSESMTRIRYITLTTGELVSLAKFFVWFRSRVPSAVSYYIIFCYDDTDCKSTSVFDINNPPEPNSFSIEDLRTKTRFYDTITPRLCIDRSVTLVLRELL